MKPNNQTMDFAQIGTLFNDATTKLVGGINEHNQASIVRDLGLVQSNLETLIQQHPDQLTGVAGIHAQNIVDQINLEMQAINSLGTDPYAAKYINDVQRDLIDIVQGDDTLAALATKHGANGFAAVPDLLAPPAQFQGNQEQTDFMKQFVADATSLSQRAVQLVDSGTAANSPQTAQLVADIQSFVSNANQFTVEQGGLYSARFNNEFALDGVNGTASRALIQGLQSGNAGQVKAAAEVLTANAADVAGNMLGIGQTPPPKTGGIPDHIDSFAQAGTVFNDATTKLIGGVFDGTNNDGNRNSIIADLTATQNGLKELLANDPADFPGKAATHVQSVIDKLGLEINVVQTATASPDDANNINAIHRSIISTVQSDPTLAALATDGDMTGFASLPGTLRGNAQGVYAGNGKGGMGNGHFSSAAGQSDHGPTGADHQFDPASNVFGSHHDHFWG